MVIKHSEILDNRVAVVEIDGPLDSLTSPGFEDYINKLLDKNILFILFDSGKMSYVSSEGIGLLLFLQRKISEANGFFVIFSLPHEILTLYALLGFDNVFRIAKDRAEAIQVMDRQMELRKKGLKEEPPMLPAEDVTIGAAGAMEPFEEMSPPPAKPEEMRKKPSAPAAEEEMPAGLQPRSRIVECSHCKSLMRVSRDGDYLCPHCNTEFTVKSRDTEKQPAEAAAPAPGFGSIIVECKKCKSLVRIKKPGTFQCPDCGTKFSVGQDRTVKF